VGGTPVWHVRVPTGVSRTDFRPTPEMSRMEFIDLSLLIDQVRNLGSGHIGAIQAKTIDGILVTISLYVVQITQEMIRKGFF